MKHVHAELIKQWADGALIQVKNLNGEWMDTPAPFWSDCAEYRIKPEEPSLHDDPSEDIESALSYFDFSEVEMVMQHMWHRVWRCGDLVKHAKDLLTRAVQGVQEEAKKNSSVQHDCVVCSGGFCAEAMIYPDDRKIYLKLSFVVTDWDNFG